VGHPCRNQEIVPSKSNTTWLIWGRGEKVGLNSTNPLNGAAEDIARW